MKILLSPSYFLKLDEKQLRAATPYPPLATLYAAALLREKGFDVQVFDTQFCDSANDLIPTLEKFRPDLFVICDDSFNYLSKMCLTNMRGEALNMQALAKRYGCKVLVSSSDAVDHYMTYLGEGADAVIAGEAELTLLEIAEHYRDQEKSFEQIAGLIFPDDGKVVRTPARPVMKDLDQLPFPAWDLIDITPYQSMWRSHHSYFSLNFVTTRGCPFKCNWCAKPVYGNRYNSHSPAYIADLIGQLQPKLGFDHIWFADDIFGLKPGWLREFTSLLQQKNLRIKYKIQSRADLLLEEENIRHLAASGCEAVWMGAESGSQKILDAMDKGISVEQIYSATRLLKANRIKASLFLQFGYPGETMQDIRQTLKMVSELIPEDIGVSVSYPLPGTVFHERVKKELKEKANWKDSDDLALMFTNTYSQSFYKRLHRYVHRAYRAEQSYDAFRKLLRFERTGNHSVKRLFGFPFYYAGAYREKQKLKQLEPDFAKSH